MAAIWAVSDRHSSSLQTAPDAGSDYGTDIDDDDINDLLLKADFQPLDDIVLTSIEQDPVTEHALIHLPSSGQEVQQATNNPSKRLPITIEAEIEYSGALDSYSTKLCT
ncbi:hypothetical protein AMS68_001055 [Peltaster fructicola]|uniref:Uncharacterized protein n=1 Tax=Peltaster fructicola TaxID=286661 RepID=A0A6H0XLN3_9PEZI|nr:hypothetical protein AMS68_001055 [Peltaster fructicola]